MPGRFFAWTPDDRPGFVLAVDDESGWDEIRRVYSPGRSNAPLERLITIAKSHQVVSVVIEQRYIDIDFRSEHSHFYSTTFKRYPSVCHRLHFFAVNLPANTLDFDGLQGSYRGYSVMRPIPAAPVGRTMIAPPPDMAQRAALCSAVDEVQLWGRRFEIEGMPFVSQDAQYMRCAHSSLWMALYHAHLRHKQPRRLPHEIHEAAIGGQVLGRQMPSDGLSAGQMLKALHELQMSGGPPLKLPRFRTESAQNHRMSTFGVLCRYVNSQMPPVVYSTSHAWVIVGYEVAPGDGPTHDRIRLIRHDDSVGPYIEVDSPFEDEAGFQTPWRGAIPPLPQKVYMTGERAELVGETLIRKRAQSVPDDAVGDAATRGDLTVRTYAVSSRSFKAAVGGRVPDPIAQLYRAAHLPRWVWIVEAVDREIVRASPAGDIAAAVVGEVVIDATASNLSRWSDPVVLAWHLGGEAIMSTPDHEETRRVTVPNFASYPSGCATLRL